jgi:hypothetical protein
MLEYLYSIDRRAVLCIFFASLTVPAGECDWKGLERHRKVWEGRLKRKWGPLHPFAMVWKKEPQKNGTPHLHCMLFWLKTAPTLREFREWNDEAWADVVKSSNPAHRRVGCNVTRMNSWNGVSWYASKYMSKGENALRAETGKIWGVTNRELMPVSIQTVYVDEEAGKRIRRAVRKLQQRRKERWERWDTQAKRWCRIYPENAKVRDGKSIKLAIEDQISTCRAVGVRVRRVRGRALSRRVIPIWGEVVETAGNSERRYVEKLGEEVHSFASALHFVKEETAVRLMDWAKKRVASDLVDEEDLPF